MKRKVGMMVTKMFYLIALSLLLCLVFFIYSTLYYKEVSRDYAINIEPTIYPKEVSRVKESNTKDQIEGNNGRR